MSNFADHIDALTKEYDTEVIEKASDTEVRTPATQRIELNNETAIEKSKRLEKEVEGLQQTIQGFLKKQSTEEELQQHRLEKGESIIHLIDTDLIYTQTTYLNRPESDYSGEDFENFIKSIGKYQKTPILIANSPENDGKFILIHGEKRLRACRANNKPVRAEIIEFNPDQHLIDGLIENMQRNDPPPYMLGVAILTIMKTNDQFKTQTSISEAIDKSRGYVSKLVKLGSIPTDIVQCFKDIRSISTYKLERFLKNCEHFKYQETYETLADQLINYKQEPYNQSIDDESLIKILNDIDLCTTLVELIKVNFTNSKMSLFDLIEEADQKIKAIKRKEDEHREKIRRELEKSKSTKIDHNPLRRKTTEKLRLINTNGKEVGFFYRLPDGTAKFKFNKDMNELAEKIRVAIENNTLNDLLNQ